MPARRHLTRAASVLATGLLLLFAYRYISDLLDDDPFADATVDWPLLVLSGLLFVVFYVLVSFNWIEAVRIVQRGADGRQFLVFMASQPFKYMPSSIFIFSSRAVFAKRLGVSLKDSSIAQLLENVALVVANVALFVVFTALAWNRALGVASLAAVIVVVALAWVGPASIRVRIARASIDVDIPTRSLVRMFVLCFVGWAIAAGAFVVLHEALSIDSYDALDLMAANTIAFVASMLAVFAPGGIGVREFVFTQYGVAALPVLTWRVVVFVVDMIVGVIAGAGVLLLGRRSSTDSEDSGHT